MTVRVRPAVDDDRSAIFTVHLRAVRETCSQAYAQEQIDVWAAVLSPDSYTPMLRKKVMLVATDDDHAVGFGQLDAAAAEVEAVYVLPERQGQGIGRKLLSALEGRARRRRINRLEVSATLNAVGFYERAGYAQRRVVMNRTMTGVELALVRMDKTLEKQHRHAR